ncbi:hypothetical protein Ais01nite_19530 [Asanoa ishikariensis]|uniref:Uncharacterized protein n=1 Tax=Asanoa ishikariensis TaxID=137265 RepID=A0A1H3UBB8_9ACTN|nr:hypothetical protein [Asanoa ishikariensis]GIF63918.1 hypothetical protein Ais01nite_19530 [Asanoa ishikariensis]SDZ59698.1 hypothetical protein SAMN05421684_6922 [Asanoa ishikariensis]
MSNQSVSEKALLLAAEARRIAVSQSDQVNEFAVHTKIDTLRKNLDQLRVVLDAARQLNAKGAAIDLTDADAGLATFRGRSGKGVPSNKALDGAINTVSEVSTKIGATLKQAWVDWCDARLGELQVGRRVMLEGKAAHDANLSLRDLEKFRNGEPRAAAITQFRLIHDSLRERLDEAPDPDPQLVELFGRLNAGTTFDKLTADDLTLIHQHKLGSTIEVRRRVS